MKKLMKIFNDLSIEEKLGVILWLNFRTEELEECAFYKLEFNEFSEFNEFCEVNDLSHFDVLEILSNSDIALSDEYFTFNGDCHIFKSHSLSEIEPTIELYLKKILSLIKQFEKELNEQFGYFEENNIG